MEINKKYQIIYADPAWQYNFRSCPPNREVTNHYKVTSTKEMANLPIKEIADNNCILFMWVVLPKLNEFEEIMKGWGFEYKTVGFVWIKKNKSGNGFFYGMGNYTRSNVELLLIGMKGKIKIKNKNMSQLLFSKVREHSRKPDEIRNKIIQLCGNLPRVELFARQKFDGWDAWGNEVPKETQKVLI